MDTASEGQQAKASAPGVKGVSAHRPVSTLGGQPGAVGEGAAEEDWPWRLLLVDKGEAPDPARLKYSLWQPFQVSSFETS